MAYGESKCFVEVRYIPDVQCYEWQAHLSRSNFSFLPLERPSRLVRFPHDPHAGELRKRGVEEFHALGEGLDFLTPLRPE